MSSNATDSLIVNGVALPDPALGGVTITVEPIWSQNAGRDADLLMVGTILGYKRTLEVKWNTLTMEQAAVLHNAVSKSGGDFKTVTFTDIDYSRKTITAYFGTPNYTVYSLADGIRYITDCSVKIVER